MIINFNVFQEDKFMNDVYKSFFCKEITRMFSDKEKILSKKGG